MVALYNATNGADWRRNDNWLTDAPVGEWYGVTTDVSGRVTVLKIVDNRLSGEIPVELGSLANLEVLNLRPNQLSGCIPAGLWNVVNNDLDQLAYPAAAMIRRPRLTPRPLERTGKRWLPCTTRRTELTGRATTIG